ncbi:hypothetical protein Q8F55_006596 [Vanrija albida]|uniref:FAS1 domain-containing protein n=1 Tax=Vanrija albida TaxID=181172 RepID=A0ABR3PXQ1_9TREE
MLATVLLLPLVAAGPLFQRQAASSDAAVSESAVAESSSAAAVASSSAVSVAPSAATVSEPPVPSTTSVIGTVQFTAPTFNQFWQIGQPNPVTWTPINQAVDLYLANETPDLLPGGKNYLLASNLPANTASFNANEKLIASGAKPGSNYYVFLTPVGNSINNLATSGGFNVLAAAAPQTGTNKPSGSASASASGASASASASATSKPSSAGKVAGVSVAAAIIAAVGAAAF